VIEYNDGGDSPDNPRLVGAPNDSKPVLVETTGLYLGLMRGRRAWVTGDMVQHGIATGILVAINEPNNIGVPTPEKAVVISPSTTFGIEPTTSSNVVGTVVEDATNIDPFGGFDPAEHAVKAVLEHIAEHPENTEAIVSAERAGKARKGILKGFD
jgi:hypothetical protein